MPILPAVETPDDYDLEPAYPPGPPRRRGMRDAGGRLLTTSERILWVSGLVLAISAFTDWYAGDQGDGLTLAVIGWHTGALGKLVFFIGLAALALVALREAGIELPATVPESLVLVALGSLALAISAALGVAAATVLGPAFLVFVVAGVALVVLYAFEVPLVHSDLGFGLAWGAFPVIATASAVGAHPASFLLAGAAAALISLAQRRLSTRARSVRRRATAISGEIVYADGSREAVDARALIGAPESALRLMWIALVALAIASLVSRSV